MEQAIERIAHHDVMMYRAGLISSYQQRDEIQSERNDSNEQRISTY